MVNIWSIQKKKIFYSKEDIYSTQSNAEELSKG